MAKLFGEQKTSLFKKSHLTSCLNKLIISVLTAF